MYPVAYKGTLETENNNENARFADFFRSEPIEIDVVSGLRQVPGCFEISTTLLCRDFCLTLKDKDGNLDEFVILAGSSPADCYEIDDKPPQSWQIRSDNRTTEIANDSHTAFPCLDHVTFFLVSLRTMRVVDFIHFKYEFIYLAHHLGVGLHEDSNLFSILSMKNQRIFVYAIENNQFMELDTIARNSQGVLNATLNLKLPEGAQRDDSWGRPGVGGIVLKLIKHLADRNGIDQVPLPASILSTLHIWKHQLLMEEKILLRLVNANLILGTNPRHQSMVHALDPLPSIHKNSYLIVYDRNSGQIEFVGNSANSELLYWMRDNWRWFRGRSADLEGFESILNTFTHTDSLSNSVVRRFTNCLPQSPQQLTDSVYFDPQIFRWDPKLTPALSRTCPISCNFFLNTDSTMGGGGLCEGNYGGERVKFFSRAQSNLLSHSLRFVDEADVQGGSNDTNMDRHKWINVLFHPTLPLVLVYQYGIFRSISLRIFYH